MHYTIDDLKKDFPSRLIEEVGTEKFLEYMQSLTPSHALFVGYGGAFPPGLTVMLDSEACSRISRIAGAYQDREATEKRLWTRVDQYDAGDDEVWEVMQKLHKWYRSHGEFEAHLNRLNLALDRKEESIYLEPILEPSTMEVLQPA